MKSARTQTTATGVLLIIAPIVAVAVKMFSFGWMMLMVVITGLILLLTAGYVVQVVIAVQGFLSKRALFGDVNTRGRTRAVIAAWITSVGVILTAIFFSDGGDTGYGSTLQVWLGSYGPNADAVHQATDTLNGVLFFIAAAAWVVGFVWLFVEWIMALVARRREAARVRLQH